MDPFTTQTNWLKSTMQPVDFAAARIPTWAMPVRVVIDGYNPGEATYTVYFENASARRAGDMIIGALCYHKAILKDMGRLDHAAKQAD